MTSRKCFQAAQMMAGLAFTWTSLNKLVGAILMSPGRSAQGRTASAGLQASGMLNSAHLWRETLYWNCSRRYASTAACTEGLGSNLVWMSYIDMCWSFVTSSWKSFFLAAGPCGGGHVGMLPMRCLEKSVSEEVRLGHWNLSGASSLLPPRLDCF